MSDITSILGRIDLGEMQATDDLLPLVYNELRRLACLKMAKEVPGQTLQATALVHEAWLRLGADAQPVWKNRRHFLGAAAEAMRRILVEKARRKARMKRGGGADHVDLDEVDIAVEGQTDDRLLQVNEALEKFSAMDSRKAALVKLRYFAGLTFEEAARTLDIAVPTAKEWLSYARAWLSIEMGTPLKM